MSLVKIHGFKPDGQKARPEYGNISIDEVVLVEMSSPNDTVIDVLAALPASPASVTADNPLGLDFTFEVSEHPENSAFILRSAGVLEQDPDSGIFWNVPLTYKIHELSNASQGSNPNPRQRKDQIVPPLSRPVVWNGSSQTVQKETYTKPDGSTIVHTNGLPITEPYVYSEEHEIHTFAKNLDYSTFNYSDYRPYSGKVSSATVFGLTGQLVKLARISFTEENESLGEGVSKTTYRFVRGTFVFEINPSGWTNDAKVVSRSTKQLIAAGWYIPIDINPRGDYATEPWPLDAAGLAIPYDAMNPANFGFVNTGYPQTANLATLVTALGFAIP